MDNIATAASNLATRASEAMASPAAATALRVAEHAVFGAVVISAMRTLATEGTRGLAKKTMRAVRSVPGVDVVIGMVLDSEVQGVVADLDGKKKGDSGPRPVFPIPATGRPTDEVLQELRALKGEECHAEDGKLFAYVYTMEDPRYKTLAEAYNMFTEKFGEGEAPSDAAKEAFIKEAYRLFQHENALNPTAFPSLRKFEVETVSMTANMLNGDENVVGNVTSGGTESILMAMKACRDLARELKPHITEPEVIASITVHPAFEKAAAYFDLKMVHVPVDAEFRMDMNAVRRAVNRNTILLVGSAPQYCHGMVDPIDELSKLALEKNLLLHVDACFGGFMLPWLEKLGRKVPVFDFRLPGVTSMSADIHKYGWGVKGASCLLFRNSELRRHMIFAYPGWPGGLFASPGMAGTRPGGILAASWAALVTQGEDGYLRVAKHTIELTDKMVAGLSAVEPLALVAPSEMTSFAIKSTDPKVHIFAVADQMEARGWKMERQTQPDSLHFSVMPHHDRSADTLIKDMGECVEEVRRNPDLAGSGSAALYGMVTSIPDDELVGDFLVKLFDKIYTPSA